MKTLPTSTKLPWYRVVNSQGSISFKKGTKQYLLQKSLLEKEGIVFIKGKFPMSKFGWVRVQSNPGRTASKNNFYSSVVTLPRETSARPLRIIYQNSKTPGKARKVVSK